MISRGKNGKDKMTKEKKEKGFVRAQVKYVKT